MMLTERIVPCGSCKACCKGNELVVMTPEDDPTTYMTEVINYFGAERFVLQRKANGDCFYLGETGCVIHARRPQVCKQFDCRIAYLDFMEQPVAERRADLKNVPGRREAMRIGKRMLKEHPLS